MRASHTRFPGQRHVVSGAPMWQKSRSGQTLALAGTLALTGDRDIFVANAACAVPAGFGHRSRDFIEIDTAVGRGLGKIPRLAIGRRGMGAAFFAPREALVDAVAVGL